MVGLEERVARGRGQDSQEQGSGAGIPEMKETMSVF